MTESRNYGMTDRLKTVYPPKTSFCGGYNDPTLEHVVTHLQWPSVAVILSARLELVNNAGKLHHTDSQQTARHNILYTEILS